MPRRLTSAATITSTQAPAGSHSGFPSGPNIRAEHRRESTPRSVRDRVLSQVLLLEVLLRKDLGRHKHKALRLAGDMDLHILPICVVPQRRLQTRPAIETARLALPVRLLCEPLAKSWYL